jgi:cell division protein FtsI/penicillin-binding protein 2
MVQDLRKHATKKPPVYKSNQRGVSPAVLHAKSAFGLVWRLFSSIFGFFFNVLRNIFYGLEQKVGRFFFVQGVFLIATLAIVFNLWFVFTASVADGSNTFLSSLQIIPAKRGNIYYRNLKFNKTVALTTSEITATITYNPSYLATNIKNSSIKLADVVFDLAANLNIPYKELENTITADINQDKPAVYAILKKNATQSQGNAVTKLQGDNSPLKFFNWLQYETVETRLYPEGKILSNVVGFASKYKTNRADTLDVKECRKMVLDNEKRATVSTFSGKKEDGVYTRGLYGLERNYCSELGGLNGREQIFSESRASKDGIVQDGADVYLTIDSSIQAKAEEILQKAIEANTYLGKQPRNGSILVVNLEDNGQLKAGDVLANASWPNADPNNYGSGDALAKGGFNNVNVSEAYEPGSVMKPITTATALNEWYNGATNKLGERTGLNPDWKFVTYGPKGKIYQEKDGGTYSIRNAENQWNYNFGGDPYAGIPIKECLYNSINTCLTDIELRVSNSEEEIKSNQYYRHDKTENYYSQRYGLGTTTLVDTFPSTTGNITNFANQIENTFQYANFSFGQGFNATPAQMVRAYTPVARLDGTLVEPHIVSSIKYDDGTVDTAETSSNPAIAVGKPLPVLNPEVSKKMNEYLRYVQQANQAYAPQLGQSPQYRGVVEEYPMGSKTGTAQVTRPDSSVVTEGKCYNGESIIDCTSRNGIYDQTYVHIGPIGPSYEGKYPKIIVYFKISETQPGLTSNNYALLNIGPWIVDMSRYTLDYLGVPPNLP